MKLRVRPASYNTSLMHLFAATAALIPLLSAWANNAAPERKGVKARSESARLFERGVHCMDELERDDCAVENFEKLIALRRGDRRYVGPAILRLVTLYQRHGEHDATGEMFRKFWDLGMKSAGTGHVPYGSRFLPPDFSLHVQVEPKRVLGARVYQQLSHDAREVLFTCDDAARERILKKHERKKPGQDRPKKKSKRQQRREADIKREAAEREAKPAVYDDGLCALATLLGDRDARTWTRFAMTRNHDDASRSAMIVVKPGLDAALAAAEKKSALRRLGPRELEWTAFNYAGKPARLLQLDRGELMLVSADLAPTLLKARDARRPTWNPELASLARRVPPEVVFFAITTKAAMADAMRDGGTVAKLMPTPEGLLIAGVGQDYGAMFLRMPTRDAVKAKMMVSLATRLVQWSAGSDPDPDQDPDQSSDAAVLAFSPDQLDIATSSDGGAVLVSTLISAQQVEAIALGG